MHPPAGARNGSRRACGGRATIRRSFNDRDVTSRGCVVALRLAWQWADDDAKGEILSLRWDRLHLGDSPYATLVRNKTGHQRHVPIPEAVIGTLKALPSYGAHEYLFPSQPTKMCAE